MTPQDLHLVDGFHCRFNSTDRYAVAETRRIFRRAGAPREGDVCLDLGAHIGSFTRRALDVGVDSVIAVEPESTNCDLWHLNMSGHSGEDRATLIQAAVDGEGGGEIPLFLSSTYGHTTVQTNRSKGRDHVNVPTVAFSDLVNEHAPTFIKMDVEGAEYSLGLPHGIPPTCDRIFIEFHLTFGNRERGIALRQAFLDSGWSPVWELGSSTKANMEGVYAR